MPNPPTHPAYPLHPTESLNSQLSTVHRLQSLVMEISPIMHPKKGIFNSQLSVLFNSQMSEMFKDTSLLSHNICYSVRSSALRTVHGHQKGAGRDGQQADHHCRQPGQGHRRSDKDQETLARDRKSPRWKRPPPLRARPHRDWALHSSYTSQWNIASLLVWFCLCQYCGAHLLNLRQQQK